MARVRAGATWLGLGLGNGQGWAGTMARVRARQWPGLGWDNG